MAAGLWLDDEGLGFALLAHVVVGLEFGVVLGEVPGDGEELVLAWEAFAEVHEGVAEVVFAGEDGHAGEVVDFLVGVHAQEEVGAHVLVRPAYVEVQVVGGLRLQEPLVLLGHVLHHCILGICLSG